MVENELSKNESQHNCECGCTADKYLTDVLETLPVNDTAKNAIAALLDTYKMNEEELTTAKKCWREEFDKRKAVEKKYKQLGQGTGFLDVEKLSTELYEAEKCEYQRQEKITALQDELARARAEANYELDKLIIPKKKDKEAMKAAGYTRQDDYEAYLRNEVLTDEIKDIEDGYKPLAEKIETLRKDSKAAAIDMKKWKRMLENRLAFAEINNRETVTCDCDQAEEKTSPEEKIRVI